MQVKRDQKFRFLKLIMSASFIVPAVPFHLAGTSTQNSTILQYRQLYIYTFISTSILSGYASPPDSGLCCCPARPSSIPLRRSQNTSKVSPSVHPKTRVSQALEVRHARHLLFVSKYPSGRSVDCLSRRPTPRMNWTALRSVW